ncbi:acetylornithine deacetylase [Pseudomonas putida]|uniref:acetylornithine deacetylase n=1 Tax=Pseudomonas putida TaxID=303 RepID=UPI00383B006C
MPTTPSPSPAVINCLSQLIAFDTVSRHSNLELIEWAAELLRSLGAKLRFNYNADRSKANLIATFGQGPGGVVLSGHTDVVPVDGQQWHSDPFTARIENGLLYGRGACDMKGFIGVVLGMAGEMAAADLREPIHIALSYDEEVGCLGIPGLLHEMRQAGIEPSGCIVGEPTSMEVVSAHKGGRIYSCHVSGCAAHSSLTPRGVNAVEYAARLITYMQDVAEQEAVQGKRMEDFDVPFSTLSTNLINGGNGLNIIPAACDFSFEYRFLPGIDPDSIFNKIKAYADDHVIPKMKAKNPAAGIEFHCKGAIPALNAETSRELQALASQLLDSSKTRSVAYGTEASFFQEVGVPTIVCGPGSIEQAHKPDEYVSLEQLYRCEVFIRKLIENCCRK